MASCGDSCSVPEAAIRLGVSYHSALRLVFVRQLVGWRDGRSWRVSVGDLERLLREREEANAGPSAA